MPTTTLARLLAVVVAATGLLAIAGPASAVPVPAVTTASSTGPYADPAFGGQCTWHVFGEGERPPWWLYLENPLCVEYAKRDITFDNGGWLVFLLAEPSRFAVAIPSCRYWQQDHWSVQVTTGGVPLVAWDGSYWFDKPRRLAAVHLRNFRVNGVTAGVGDVATALRPSFPRLADALAVYGAEHGESGLTISLPVRLLC